MSQEYAHITRPALSTAPPKPFPLTPVTGRTSTSIARRDAIAGATGGIVATLLGQPFDLIKVRLQTSNSSDVLRVAKNVWVHEGPLAFYKGATLPFLGSGVSVSIQFTVFHSCRQIFERQNAVSQDARGSRISNGQAYLAGCAAGVANSAVACPVEHIRTRLQLQAYGAAKLYNGTWDCLRQVVRQAGIPGLFKAFPITMVKECQAFGCYFAAFEASIGALGRWEGKERKDMSLKETIPCGAIGGMAFWLGSYPIDVVKSKLQADAFGEQAKFPSVRAAMIDTWQRGGFRGFWRGLAPTLVRTSLSSAGCFAMVEQVRKMF